MATVCMLANSRPFMVAGKRIAAGATFDCEIADAADLATQGRASAVTDDGAAAIANFRKQERDALEARLAHETRQTRLQRVA
jgi:hypothetical protein